MAAATSAEFEMKGAGAFSSSKRKRGRPPKGNQPNTAADAPMAKKNKNKEEDVCFICFDGGTLVLCDRRDCPKAYHPACVKRDEAFFHGRVRWNCGWHICNSCQRNAHFMCYTCPYSLCKGCVKQADIVCIRRNKGFCRTCMTTVMLIENFAKGNKEKGQVDFDDKSCWEYLFKVYWIYLKQKESLTFDELTRATNPWKGSGWDHKDNTSQKMRGTVIDKAAALTSATRLLDVNISKRRKIQRQTTLHNKDCQRVEEVVDDKVPCLQGDADWASKELLEFIAHIKNGDTSVLCQFDVQALLLEYIRRNNLRDPRQKCQIICDKRLENLFGRSRVGHFEMLKLLEYHFKEDYCLNGTLQGAVISPVAGQVETDESSEVIQTMNKDNKRRTRKKGDERRQKTDLDNYAAIDVHNINLVYLKRNLMENLMEDAEKFHDKVMGSIVRIRISGNDQKQDVYRLVRVVGTGRVSEPYKIGNKTANVKLKILNLNKIEEVTIDVISNQEFSEDECRRLRQSIRCGLGERMTVGEIKEKAIALQTVRVNDLLETEVLRLNHLRDRASETGHRKELRETVEKLKLLNTPEEHQHRLLEIPKVFADPRMHPGYESDEDTGQSIIYKQDSNMSLKSLNSNAKAMELITLHQGGDMSISPRARAFKSPGLNWGQKRNMCTNFQPGKVDCESPPTLEGADAVSRILVELKNGGNQSIPTNSHAAMTSENLPRVSSNAPSSLSTGIAVSSDVVEMEKVWHYEDPSRKIQGPFCMLQLHKWNLNGYFPTDLRIWRTNESQDKSVLLTDALTTSNRNIDCVVGLRVDTDSYGTDCKPNEEGCSELTQATACSYANDLDQSLEQKWNLFPVRSSCTCKVPESYQKPNIEISDLPSPTQKAINDNLKAESLKSEQSAASDVPGQIELVADDNSKSLVVDDKQPATENVPRPHLDAHPNRIRFSNLLSQDNDKAQATEAQQSITLNISGHSSGASWATAVGVEISDPPTTAAQDNQGVKVQPVDSKLYATSTIPCQDDDISWGTASGLVGTVIQLPDIAAAWGGYPPVHSNAKPSVDLLDSLRPMQPGNNHATLTQEICQLSHPTLTQLDYSTSRWHGMEPIELSTLGDESVSDLLSEVEALESLHGMAFPTSRMKCRESLMDSQGNDCFSLLVGLNPPLDPGKHHSMTNVPHGAFPVNINNLPSHSSPSPEEFVSFEQQDIYSGAHLPAMLPSLTIGIGSSAIPMAVGDVKPAYASPHQRELASQPDSHKPSQLLPPTEVSEGQPPALLPLSTASVDSILSPGEEREQKQAYVSENQQELVSESHPPEQPPLPSSAEEEGKTRPAYDSIHQPESVSRPTPWRSLDMAAANAYWGSVSKTVDPGQVTMGENSNASQIGSTSGPQKTAGTVNTQKGMAVRANQPPSRGGSNNAVRYSGLKDRSWLLRNQQTSTIGGGGSSVGGSSRLLHPPRGQRVCKYYESGCCEKGALCNYLHP